MNDTVLSCPACQTVVSSYGGRCPSCGAELPPVLVAAKPSLAPGVAAARVGGRPRRSFPVVPVAAGAMVLVALGVGAAVHLRGSSQPAAGSARPTGSAALALVPSGAVALDALDSIARGVSRASRWSAESALVTLEARGVKDAKLTPGGTLELAFGKRTGTAAAGAKVGAERLVLAFSGTGGQMTEREGTGPAGARSVHEPNCNLDEAWRRAVASGMPAGDELSFIYAWNEKLGRAVWLATHPTDPKLSRTLDGETCAVVVR
ncbi:MAG: hypothetical protein IT376_14025 [Polyangiaceae bacterium]|nr:hypothetical protein [Polyangiaceae bacterium]